MKYTLPFLILLAQISCSQNQHEKLGIENAKKELKTALTDTIQKQILADTIIKDEETAIAVSEPILFKIYGKDNIIKQKPYEIYFIDGYWILNGTLPVNSFGGGFIIILKASNGQVVRLAHYK